MLRLAVVVVLMLVAMPASSNTVPDDIRSQVRAPEKIGEVKVRFLGLRLYSASLCTEQGGAFDWTKPFALQLKYDCGFDKKRLVQASMSELERLEGQRSDHPDIESKLNKCFKSVRASDRFVAAPSNKNTVRFFFNGKQTCSLSHPGISQRVLGIWLSDNARDTRLSRALRGL